MNEKYLLFIFCAFFFRIDLNGQSATDSSCITRVEKKLVLGTSLQGLVENGDSVLIAYGFYDCNPVVLNDIVVYRYAGLRIPVIKVVGALPGDTFHIIQENNFYCIEVNSRRVTNSDGTVYVVPRHEYGMLKMYEDSYHGIIPPDGFLILGNKSGTTDSGKFGLVSKSDILGRVIRVIP